jgi:hypothetical protein
MFIRLFILIVSDMGISIGAYQLYAYNISNHSSFSRGIFAFFARISNL